MLWAAIILILGLMLVVLVVESVVVAVVLVAVVVFVILAIGFARPKAGQWVTIVPSTIGPGFSHSLDSLA